MISQQSSSSNMATSSTGSEDLGQTVNTTKPTSTPWRPRFRREMDEAIQKLASIDINPTSSSPSKSKFAFNPCATPWRPKFRSGHSEAFQKAASIDDNSAGPSTSKALISSQRCDSSEEVRRINRASGDYTRRQPFCKKSTLIVNYLPQKMTDRALYDLFAPYGPLQNVKIMREHKSGYSFGYAFVNYCNFAGAIQAQKHLNGFPIENKHLKVSLARPSSEDIKNTNLYITRLPTDINEDKFYEMFAPFGNIVTSNLLRCKGTGLPIGTGFVRFDKHREAIEAIEALHHFVPCGGVEPIKIQFAEDHLKHKGAYLAGMHDALSSTPSPKRLFAQEHFDANPHILT